LTSDANVGLSTQKVAVLRRLNHWFIRAVVLVCTKGISSRPDEPAVDESYMALTFGTLLSSQGADAHLLGPFGPIGGNPRHITRSVPHGQTRPAPPELPLGRGDSVESHASCLGDDRPAPPTCTSRRGRCVAPLRERQ
jgi:hypothetical protein